MSNPLRNFDSRLHDKKFEDGGITIGLPALFSSMDARDDFVKRDAGEATYFEPGRSAQRKIGTWVTITTATKIDPADASDFQDAADFQDAGYLTMKKAFDDEGLGDYFEAAFPYELLIWYDPRNVGILTATPAFPTNATVFTHSALITDDNGVLLANHIGSVLAGATLAAWDAFFFGPLDFTHGTYPHKRSSTGANFYTNPDVNTDGQHTLYAEAYGRSDVPYSSNVDFILTEPEGVALKAYFDGLNPTGLDLKDSLAAQGMKSLLTRHANLPIFYLEPFDNLTNSINTPF